MTENQVFFDTELKKYVKIVKEETVCEPGQNLCDNCPYRNTNGNTCLKHLAGRCFDYYTFRFADDAEIEAYRKAQGI